MTFNCFIAYFIILFIATITPGPSMLLALSHGVNHGVARSVFSGLGNLVGNLSMALVSILGLSAVLISSGYVFNVIRWAGIAYLTFIGLKLLLEPIKADAPSVHAGEKQAYRKRKRRLFVDGFIIAIGNPKGILFFTALFPQFITKSGMVGSLGAIFITLGIVAFGCYMLYAAFGARLNKLFLSYSFKKIFNRITGSIFIGTGVALAFSRK